MVGRPRCKKYRNTLWECHFFNVQIAIAKKILLLYWKEWLLPVGNLWTSHLGFDIDFAALHWAGDIHVSGFQVPELPKKKHNMQALKSRQFYYPPLTLEGSYYCKYMYLCCIKNSWCKSVFCCKMCSQESLTWCGRVQTKNTKRNPDFTPVTAWIFLGTKSRGNTSSDYVKPSLENLGGRADGSHKTQLHDLVHLSPLNLWV